METQVTGYPDDLSDDRFVHLTTTGRRSGLPHTVELWFLREGARVYLIAGIEPPIVGGRPDWLRNLERDPHVSVRIGAKHFAGLARVDLASVEIGTAMAAKYMGSTTGTTLPKWASEGHLVTVDLVGDHRLRDALRDALDEADRQFGPMSAELIEAAKSELLRNRAKANP